MPFHSLLTSALLSAHLTPIVPLPCFFYIVTHIRSTRRSKRLKSRCISRSMSEQTTNTLDFDLCLSILVRMLRGALDWEAERHRAWEEFLLGKDLVTTSQASSTGYANALDLKP
ncbi:hypothetical protein FRC12_018934 [Ceratobasidium sp. 428]|nr:hypothetical protein FRC12_018934 [Ceratobasidium sp. 428]